MKQEKHSVVFGRKGALSYGPFGYLQSLVAGFVLGGITFLIAEAGFTSEPGGLDQLPNLLFCIGGGAALLAFTALFANYLIGRRIRDAVELERAIFAGGTLPPPRPRPDVPGIDLGRASAPHPADLEADHTAGIFSTTGVCNDR